MPGPFQAVLYRSIAVTNTVPIATGWTEVYYPKAGDITAASALANELNTVLSALYPASVRLTPIKVSDLTVKGDVSLPAVEQTTGTYGVVPGPSPVVGDPNYAILLKIFGADPKHRSIHYIRGLAALLFNSAAPLTVTATPELGTALANVAQELVTSFQGITKKPGTPPLFTPWAIDHCTYPPANSAKEIHIRRSGRPFGLRRGRHLV